MTAQLLPNKLTPIAPDQAGSILATAYASVAGHAPSEQVLNILLAHWAAETGNGQAVHNYNFGNVKRSKADQYYQEFNEREVVDGKDEYAVRQWAAYTTPLSGARAWIALLHARPAWWAGLHANLQSYVHALATAPAYFTAKESQYYELVAGLMKRYAAIARKYSPSQSTLPFLAMAASAGVVLLFFLGGAALG
jgi:hypothetical protein